MIRSFAAPDTRGAAPHAAAYVGCVGKGNLGDETLFAAARALFSGRLELRGYFKRSSVQQWPLLRPKFDAVVLGGGTLITKGPRLYLGAVQRLLALNPRARLIVFGPGVADRDWWAAHGVALDVAGWTQLLGRACFIGVRGPQSERFLRDWGVTAPIRVIGDPALAFTREHCRPKRGERRVGLNLGPARGRVFGSEDDLHRRAVELLRRLHAGGWRATLFPMIQADLDYMTRIAQAAGVATETVWDPALDPRSTLAALAQQDLFIGQKLHSVVLATCVATPAIMLAYREKGADFMQSIGREDYLFRTDEIDLDAITALLERMHGDLEREQRAVHAAATGWAAELRRAAADAWAALALE